MGDADHLIRRFERLRGDRATWERHWQEVAEVFQPRHGDFAGTRTPGAKRTAKVFDATPLLVPLRFAAAMESLMTPRGAFWHGLTVADEALAAHPPVKTWLETVRRRLFRCRYNPHAGFGANTGESYLNLGLYGTQVLYTEEGFDRAPILYRALPLAECFLAADAGGRIDTLFRLTRLTARQAALRWGAEALSPRVRRLLDDPAARDSEVTMLTCVLPRAEAETPRRLAPGMTHAVVHLEPDTRHVVAAGGAYEFPFHVSRFAHGAREVYGRGPAMSVLPDAKMLNAMNRTTMRAAEKAVDPPLAVGDDGDMPRPNLNPGAINPGAVNDQGRPLIVPINSGARPEVGTDAMQAKRAVINDAFWVTLFQVLNDKPGMTATEVMERALEKAQLIGPALARQETELLGPMIEREYAILARKGLIPPPPAELADAGLEVEYTSPGARLRRAAEGAGILRTVEAAAAIAPFAPEAADVLDGEAMLRAAAEINGLPPALLRGADAVVRRRAARAAAGDA